MPHSTSINAVILHCLTLARLHRPFSPSMINTTAYKVSYKAIFCVDFTIIRRYVAICSDVL